MIAHASSAINPSGNIHVETTRRVASLADNGSQPGDAPEGDAPPARLYMGGENARLFMRTWYG